MSPIFSQDQQSDPIEQLLYACFHARRSLDRLDRAIFTQFPQPRAATPQERNQIRNKIKSPDELRLLDLLYATPYGSKLADTQHHLRTQLANIAKQYVSLGIEERRTRMSEAWAAVILPLFEAIASDPNLNLTRHQQEVLPQIVEHHLRVIEGGSSEETLGLNIKEAANETHKLTDTQRRNIGAM